MGIFDFLRGKQQHDEQAQTEPFQKGIEIGKDTRERGWLEIAYNNSTNQHKEDAQGFTEQRYPHASEEDKRTIAAGIMHEWLKTKNWPH